MQLGLVTRWKPSIAQSWLTTQGPPGRKGCLHASALTREVHGPRGEARSSGGGGGGMAARNLLRRAAYAAACGHRFPVPVPSGALAGSGSRSIGAAAQVCPFPTSCKPLLLPASCAKANQASSASLLRCRLLHRRSPLHRVPISSIHRPRTPHASAAAAGVSAASVLPIRFDRSTFLVPKKFRLFPLLILESVFSPLVHSDFGIGNGL